MGCENECLCMKDPNNQTFVGNKVSKYKKEDDKDNKIIIIKKNDDKDNKGNEIDNKVINVKKKK